MAAVVFVGIVVIVLGIMGLVNGKKKHPGEKIAARVRSCEAAQAELMGQTVFCYNVTLEIFTPGETVIQTIQDREPYEEGQYIDVYYDAQKNAITPERYRKDSNSKGGWMIIGFGVLLIGLGVSLDLMKKSEEFAEIMKVVLLYGSAILFTAIGAGLFLAKHKKLKNQLENSSKIEGTLVDYKEEYNSDNHSTYYRPIYSYFLNDLERRLEGSVAGSGAKYRQIGRKVTIVVNNTTKEVYCLEDAKEQKNFALIFFVVGLLMLAFAICRSLGLV